MEKGAGVDIADLFYQHFAARGWRNASGARLKNWKTAAWEWAFQYT